MKFLLSILLLSCFYFSYSQDLAVKKYYKFDNSEVKSIDSAFYFVEIYKPDAKNKYVRIIEKFKNGQLKQTGFAIEKYLPIYVFDSTKTTYSYGSEKISSIKNYRLGILNGPALFYYPNEKLAEEGSYKGRGREVKYQAKQIFDENGNSFLDETASGNIKISYPNGNLIEGKYKKGYKDGFFKTFNSRTKIIYEDVYENGEFVGGTTIYPDGRKTVYKELYTAAHPKNSQFFRSLDDGEMLPISYSMKTNGEGGQVIFRLDVDINGLPNNFKLIKSVSKAVDDKAYQYIKDKKWNAATNRGETVNTKNLLFIVNYDDF